MHNLSVEKTYTCLCRDVDQNVHILSWRQALIKFELRVCTERRPIALLRVLLRDFPFLPFSLSLFLRTIAFETIRRTSLAVRRIVTKGFAVILDLICMLMIMDVYPLLFPGFVAACYSFKSCLRGSSLKRNAGGCQCFIRSCYICTCLLREITMATKLNIDKNSIDVLQYIETDASRKLHN